MNITAINTKIWRKDFKRKDGKEFYKYTASIGRKTESGTWINAYIPVVFSKKTEVNGKIDNGAICDFEGFMSVGSDKDRDGNTRNFPQIVITSVEFADPSQGVDSFEQASGDIPF